MAGRSPSRSTAATPRIPAPGDLHDRRLRGQRGPALQADRATPGRHALFTWHRLAPNSHFMTKAAQFGAAPSPTSATCARCRRRWPGSSRRSNRPCSRTCRSAGPTARPSRLPGARAGPLPRRADRRHGRPRPAERDDRRLRTARHRTLERGAHAVAEWRANRRGASGQVPNRASWTSFAWRGRGADRRPS